MSRRRRGPGRGASSTRRVSDWRSATLIVGLALLAWPTAASGQDAGASAAAGAAASTATTAAPPISVSAARSLAAAQGIDPKEIRAPSRRRGSWIAKVLVRTNVRRKPGAKRIWRARTATTFNRQAQRLLVLGARRAPSGREWLRVRLPIRPNGASGWIPRDRVLLTRTRYWITIDVSRRRVRVHRARRARGRRAALVKERRAVVGKRSTPTPRGLHAVYETVRQPDPNAFLGNWALHLTAHSNVHFNFGGGDGRVAIHGRGGRSLATPLGTAGSNGCVRMNKIGRAHV